MKAVIAMDSFKGSLTSLQAGEAVKAGILRVFPKAETLVLPVADGGEGTVEALLAGMGGRKEKAEVTDPVGRKIWAEYGIIGEKTAVIEMAAAAGLTLLSPQERNPLFTTSYGVGELICDAAAKGCRRFLIGIGGSATNDGGVGMLQALGYEFLDQDGKPILPGARGLEDLAEIRTDKVLPELSTCRFRIVCDVKNPLCGEQGCSAVYGPQKGADQEMIYRMDAWLAHYAQIVGQCFENADPAYPGAGAAGGMGFAFLAFTNSVLEPGVKIVLEELKMEEAVKTADLVITGEGRLDGQTAMGKVPAGVAGLAKRYGKPVLAFAGAVTEEARECNRQGIDAFFPVLRKICTLEEAMEEKQAKKNLADTTEQVFRLFGAVGGFQ